VPLSDVAVGTTAVVRAVTPTDNRLEVRLEHVGFIPGTTVTVERRAPLGDPTVYVLRGYRLGLRRESARLIEVEVVETATSGPKGAHR